jgi:hypothetical protein
MKSKLILFGHGRYGVSDSKDKKPLYFNEFHNAVSKEFARRLFNSIGASTNRIYLNPASNPIGIIYKKSDGFAYLEIPATSLSNGGNGSTEFVTYYSTFQNTQGETIDIIGFFTMSGSANLVDPSGVTGFVSGSQGVNQTQLDDFFSDNAAEIFTGANIYNQVLDTKYFHFEYTISYGGTLADTISITI